MNTPFDIIEQAAETVALIKGWNGIDVTMDGMANCNGGLCAYQTV